MTGIRAYSITNTVIGETEVGPTNQIDIRAVPHAFLSLGSRSRARRFRSPQPDPIPEEPVRTNQQNPSRDPHPHSGLLEQGCQSTGNHRADSRLPDLEEYLHFTFSSVDQLRLRRHQQDPCIPQSFRTFPYQCAVGKIRGPVPPRSLLPDHPSHHHSTQIHCHPRSTGEY